MDLNRLPPELLILIFQSLPDHKDLANVCRVSRAFNALATPVLYRSIIATTKPSFSPMTPRYDVLIERLLHESNKTRFLVRELTLKNPHYLSEETAFRILKALPNLETIYFIREITDTTIQAIILHKRLSGLYLLGESGHTPTNVKMPLVRELRTRVTGTKSPKTYQFALHEVFKAFPNLETLSLKIDHLTARASNSQVTILPLAFSEDETFPPLKSLIISGYKFQDSEVSIWKEKFFWNQLKSLSVGPQCIMQFPAIASGLVYNLKRFELTKRRNNRRVVEPVETLNTFLSSFSSLEVLIARGIVPSIAAVAHHHNLQTLCLHEMETPEEERKNLEIRDIEYLDKTFPKLTNLEIDMNGWLDEIICTLAASFQDLRQLSIHVGLGIGKLGELSDSTTQNALLASFPSVLTESTALRFAKRFFSRRGTSSLKCVSLKTGELLSGYPPHPAFILAESSCAGTYEVYAPKEVGDEPSISDEIYNPVYRGGHYSRV